VPHSQLSASKESNDTRSGQGFTQTRWTLILRAEKDQSPAARAALDYLCARYWPSIYAFLRRKGYGRHDAEDLTQGFLSKVLETRSISRADPSMGRFRNFLLRMLKDYLVDEVRRREALKRGGPNRFGDLPFHEAEELYLTEPDPGLSPEEVFDRGWAASLMESAYQKLEAEFEKEGQRDRFLLLKPFIAQEASKADCENLAEQLKITPKSASVTVYRLRTRFRHFIRDEVLSTVADAEAVNAEFMDLFGIGGS
jgi:RNA polymerase sigma factor (sigma-70 family)